MKALKNDSGVIDNNKEIDVSLNVKMTNCVPAGSKKGLSCRIFSFSMV